MELAASDKSCEDLAISHPEFLPPTYPWMCFEDRAGQKLTICTLSR